MSSLPGPRAAGNRSRSASAMSAGLVGGQRGLHQVGDLARVRRLQPADVLGGLRPAPSSPAPRPACPRPPRARRARSARPGSRRRRTGAPRRAPWPPAGRSRRPWSGRGGRPRRGPSGDTPCAENTTRAPSGTSLELVHEDRAAALQVGHHVRVVHDLLAHVDRRRRAARGPARRSRWPAPPRRRTTAARPAAPAARPRPRPTGPARARPRAATAARPARRPAPPG